MGLFNLFKKNKTQSTFPENELEKTPSYRSKIWQKNIGFEHKVWFHEIGLNTLGYLSICCLSCPKKILYLKLIFISPRSRCSVISRNWTSIWPICVEFLDSVSHDPWTFVYFAAIDIQNEKIGMSKLHTIPGRMLLIRRKNSN